MAADIFHSAANLAGSCKIETVKACLSDAHKLHGKISANCDVIGSWCYLSILLLCQDRHPCLGIGASEQAASLVPK